MVELVDALKSVSSRAGADETVRKTYFSRHLYIKTIILPRQARDKHRENSKKGRFSQGVSYECLTINYTNVSAHTHTRVCHRVGGGQGVCGGCEGGGASLPSVDGISVCLRVRLGGIR
jgi:hypothetical protein